MNKSAEGKISAARDRLELADTGSKYSQIGNILLAIGHLINAVEAVALDLDQRLTDLEKFAHGED